MGMDIIYYADTDLIGLSAKEFLEEVERRVGKVKIRTDRHDSFPGGQWSTWGGKEGFEEIYRKDIEDGDLTFCYAGKDINMEVLFGKNHAWIDPNIDIDDEYSEFSYKRFNHFCRELDEDRDRTLYLMRKFLKLVKEIVVPLTHSRKILLLADCYLDKHWRVEEQVLEKGLSIEDALALNSTYEDPVLVYTEEDLQNKSKSFYDDDWGVFYLTL